MMKTVYLGLGSNLGDRKANIEAALERLNQGGIEVRRQSRLYETAPRDFVDQPWFLNMVAECETDLLPATLLKRVLRIEADLGRRRTRHKGPRVIDIDILLYAGAVIDTEDLKVPHPSMMQRRFVLEPLAELAPELRHPVTGGRIRDLLAGVMDQSLHPFGGEDPGDLTH